MANEIEYPTAATHRVKRKRPVSPTHAERLARFKARELAWKVQTANRVEWFNEPVGTVAVGDEPAPEHPVL